MENEGYILVVDDSPVACRIIVRELSHGGYISKVASNGDEALRMVAENPPLLVTLDVNMAGKNGYETCTLLREQTTKSGDGAGRQHIPVVFITGVDTIKGREQGFEVGGTAFITKPFKQGELLHRVNQILRPVSEWVETEVLIVEDSDITQTVIEMALAGRGIKTIAVGTAPEAMELLEAKPDRISLVLCDYFLPGMKGDEFCAAVRQNPTLSELPIVMLSAASDRTYILKMFKSGASDYIAKPFVEEELLARIEVHLQARQLMEDLRGKIVELERLGEAKTKLLSLTSHDLRTPINSMKGYFELILEEGNTPEDKALFKKEFQRATDMMLGMVDNLSTIGKALSTERELELGPVVLSDAVRSAVFSQGEIAEKKGIQLELEPAESNAIVLAESTSLIRILGNLISNAVKFTDSGGHVKISIAEPKEGCCEISVKDTGIGIPEAMIPSLFDVYSRASRRGTGGELGTGLGLAICKQLVEKLNGRLTVVSKLDEGTTVTIAIPEFE